MGLYNKNCKKGNKIRKRIKLKYIFYIFIFLYFYIFIYLCFDAIIINL
jgi:hypothetical protein